MHRTYQIEYLTNDSRLRMTRFTADGPAAARALFVAGYGLPADSIRSVTCDGKGRSGPALGRSGAQSMVSGAFPLWAVFADRTAAAIDESLALGLFDDCDGWEELPAGLESAR